MKQDKITFNHGKIVNIYTVYELDKIYVKTTPTLVNCLFGAVSLTKNTDIATYKYSGYRIGFDRGNIDSFGNGFGRNVIIYGADMNTSVHFDNKGKYILILGKGSTQGLGEHSLTVEKIYSVNPTDHRKKYCLSLQYNGANSYLFANGIEIIKFKAKDSEIVPTPLCLWNISKDWSADNIKDTGLNGYVYDLSVDFDAAEVDDIKDINKHLMKKNNII